MLAEEEGEGENIIAVHSMGFWPFIWLYYFPNNKKSGKKPLLFPANFCRIRLRLICGLLFYQMFIVNI